MKARIEIEFNLPEDADEMEHVVHGPKYFSALWDFSQQLRGWCKYGTDYKTVQEALDEVRVMFYDVISEKGVIDDM